MISSIDNNYNIDFIKPSNIKKTIIQERELSKVESIKESIKQGEYKISITNTAEALANHLLGE
jgi:anti-sigma28 factor (negative regulator of flagellin synthesis)